MKILSRIMHIFRGIDVDELNKKITDLENDLKIVWEDSKNKSNLIAWLEHDKKTLCESLVQEQIRASIAQKQTEKVFFKLSKIKKLIALLVHEKIMLIEKQKFLSSQNLSLRKENKIKKKRISILEEENSQLQKTANKIHNESSVLFEKIEGLNCASIKVNQSIPAVAEIEELNTEIERLKEELAREKEDAALTDVRLRELIVSTGQKDSTIDTLKKQLEFEIQAKNSLSATINDLQTANGTLQSQIDSLQTHFDNLKREVDNRIPICNEMEIFTAQVPVEDTINEANTDIGDYQKDSILKSYKIENSNTDAVEELGNINPSVNITSKEFISDADDDKEDAESINSMQDVENTKSFSESTQNNSACNNECENDSDASDASDEASAGDINDASKTKDTSHSSDNSALSDQVVLEYNDEPLESPIEDSVESEANDDGNHSVVDEDSVIKIITETTDNEVENDDDVLDDDTLPLIYDNSLIPAEKLSIPAVYDTKENKCINAKEFFLQNENELILWRRHLQEEYLTTGHTRFICPGCKKSVKISGHKLARGRVCYFAHFKESENCPYKTGKNRTKEEIERLKYSLVQESERHKRLKTAIATALEGEKSRLMGVRNVVCDKKRINSDIPYLNWRRPDIYAEYNGRRYVFELQLSTTFVSVIVDRDIFYRLNNYNIIWIFNFEDNQEYVNLQNLMCKDIYYANKRNVFIFDKDTEEKSTEKGELVLKCKWLDENGEWSNDEYVTLEMFQYDEETHKPFIFDADKAYLAKFPEYAERRKQLEHSREYLLNAIMERQKAEEEIERRKAEKRSSIQRELLNKGKTVARFRSGTKFGYRYEGTIILPAKYTSAEDIREDGYAQVGFNRKIGLVRKDGKEIVPTEYKDIRIINNRHGVIIAIYKSVDLWLGDEKINLCPEYDDKKQDIIEEEENGKTKYILRTETYEYTYKAYTYHLVRRKIWKGHSKTSLFSIVEEKDSCIIWVGDEIFLLSDNRLTAIGANYSDIKSIGVDLLYIVKNSFSHLWGIIDQMGNVITDFRFAELIPTGSEFLIAKYTKESTTYGIVDCQGREFAPSQHRILIYLNSDLFAFNDGELWGIQNRFGNTLHEPEYSYVRMMPDGCLMASTSKSCLHKWEIRNNIPSYEDENIKLCLLNDKGDIVYAEQSIGEYYIRHSGDLYSIISSDGHEFIGYSLSYMKFISDTTAIVKDENDIAGLFVNEKITFFDKDINQQLHQCKNIEHLTENIFRFEDDHGKYALGDYSGPITQYSYDRIQVIPDTLFFIAYTDNESSWEHTGTNECVIFDRTCNKVSEVFSSIGEFKNGFAEAVYNGHHGTIDTRGVMQDKIVEDYGDYILYEKFGRFYFRNKDNNIGSDIYSSVEHLVDMYFSVVMYDESNVRLFSAKTKQTSTNNFTEISHLVDDLFVTVSSNGDKYLYKGTERLSTECYRSVTLLDNGYLALQKETQIGNHHKLTWKLASKNGICINHKEYDSILEANQEYFKVIIDGQKGAIDLDGNVIIEKESLNGNLVLIRRFADYGLEDSDGKVILSLDDHFSAIEITENGLIKVCQNNKYALYNADGTKITEHEFSSISYEGDDRYAITKEGVNGHINSLGNYIDSITDHIEVGIIFVVMEKYGLRDFNGNIVIPSIYTSISYLHRNLLVVRKDSLEALFNADGTQLTEFKYSSIFCNENECVLATRNNVTGKLDEDGNEIADIIHFNGGYIKQLFEEYTVENDLGENIIAKGYTKIELLDNSGIFSLYKGSDIAIGNTSGKKTGTIFKSVKSIGNGFFVVSIIIKKIERVHKIGHYRSYWTSRTIENERYGMIDKDLQRIMSFKYISISGFDSEQNIYVTDSNNKIKSISLSKLRQSAFRISELSIGMEYHVEVVAFKYFGIIVNLQGKSFLIHKKYLFKDIRQFKKGDSLVAKYLGNDEKCYHIWETKAVVLTD